MKEFVDVHDFLVSAQVVGDWDGQEDHVAEQINEFYHAIYDMAEEDIPSSELEDLLNLVWDIWIGDDNIAEIGIDEIHDWCRNFLDNREQFLQQD